MESALILSTWAQLETVDLVTFLSQFYVIPDWTIRSTWDWWLLLNSRNSIGIHFCTITSAHRNSRNSIGILVWVIHLAVRTWKFQLVTLIWFHRGSRPTLRVIICYHHKQEVSTHHVVTQIITPNRRVPKCRVTEMAAQFALVLMTAINVARLEVLWTYTVATEP